MTSRTFESGGESIEKDRGQCVGRAIIKAGTRCQVELYVKMLRTTYEPPLLIMNGRTVKFEKCFADD